MKIDFGVRKQDGLAKGARFMFAEGHWTDSDVRGVTISMFAFDTIYPLVQAAWPEWDGYCGASEIPPVVAARLEAALRDRAISSRGGPSEMCNDLANWIQVARKDGGVLSLLGV